MFKNKSILVTGGTGSIGNEIVRRVLQYEPRVVRVFSTDENALFHMEQELQGHQRVRFLIGDVRDVARVKRAVEGIDFVFHAAALKHVPLCEYNPFEAVKTNVLGTQNLIEAVMENENIEKVITISTDKAINPVNVMGATKLLAERLTISANYYKGARKTVFSCIRFGNVLNSRGSVVPLFREQIKKGGPVTITDPGMTRFVMSIHEAIDLVFKAAEIARGGEVFILKMPALYINDLAEVMIEELAPQYGYDPKSIMVEISGKRPGEKTYEELLTRDEALNASEADELFILSQGAGNQQREKTSIEEYRSDKDAVLLAKKEIKEMLKEYLSQPL
ncbi:MAG: UDP-N-acetylglucosamine 4,6-dehydratase family protein [Chloroflexota bacterium]|nr:UDP-N-acetylglucosamine 4,6-dehydratase family protein [Chloroflexota bacterium]